MLGKLWEWLGETNVSVRVVERRRIFQGEFYEHTVVRLPDGGVRYLPGWQGDPGDEITVKTWELYRFK